MMASATDLKRIVVTPAGRRRYLEILLVHLAREHRAGGFAEWHVWVNTNVERDIEYIRGIAAEYDWIRAVELPGITCVDNLNICRFFRGACDPLCVYLRLDDDIVYVEPGFCDKLFRFRVANPEPFLVYGNIINNAVITHVHQRNRRFEHEKLAGYACMDSVGWKDGELAECLHRAFLSDAREGRVEKWHRSFDVWKCYHYERVSINCIAWLGSTFKDFGGEVGRDEEQWLSVDKPRALQRPNVIYGGAIVAHFAFYPQRGYLEEKTNVLEQYRALAQAVKG